MPATHKIENDRLVGVKFVSSPNQGGRMTPTCIVLHDTASPNADGTIAWFQNPKAKVSAHVVVEDTGETVQMVEFDRIAWHAGRSSFMGRQHVNGFGIGVEIRNPGKIGKGGKFGWKTERRADIEASDIEWKETPEHGAGYWQHYPRAQVDEVVKICQALVAKYPTIRYITTHWEISPGRKVDPNPTIDLDYIRRKVFDDGASAPTYRASGVVGFGDQGPQVREIQTRLRDLGYQLGSPDASYGSHTRAAVLAFQAENDLPTTGNVDSKTRAALYSSSAKENPVGSRSESTLRDLRKTGSKTIERGDHVKGWSILTGIIAAIGSAVERVFGSINSVGDVTSKINDTETLVKSTGGVLDLIVANFIPFGIVVLGAAVWLGVHIIQKQRLKDHQTGANMGR